jgi:hypothetical protein
MAKYTLTAAAVIDGALRQAGEEVDFDGVPGDHMEPLDAAAKKAAGAKREMPALNPDMVAHPEERFTPGVARERDPRREPKERDRG